MKNIKQILILGGTGAIGKALVGYLAADPEIKCVITSRRNIRGEGNITYAQGNAHDSGFLTSLLDRKWDAIIDFMAYTTEELKERIGLLLSSTSQYIFLSSSRVYADSKNPIREDSPRLLNVCKDQEYLETDEYALAKAREEDIIRSSGSNYTIIRPYITFSEERFQLGVMEKENWLYRALHGRTIVFSKDIANKITTLSSGADVAKGMCGIICNEKAYGKTFHIATKECHTWDSILQIYLSAIEKITGRKTKVFYTDRWKPWQGGFKYQVKYDRLFDRRFDNTAILNAVPNLSFNDLEESVNKALSEMVKHPSYAGVDFSKEAVKDRFTGDWTKLGEIPGIKGKIKYLFIRLGLIKYTFA